MGRQVPHRRRATSRRGCFGKHWVTEASYTQEWINSPHAASSGRQLGAIERNMDRIRIVGGNRLEGIIPISGAKNAALPLMIASLLTSDRLTLKNVPNLADVNLLARILRNHGVDLAVDGKRLGVSPHLGETFHLTARDIVDTTAPYEMVSRMRASFWVLGPLIARMGVARVSLPGGCAIGTRPVDLHLEGLKALGAEIEIDGGYVIAKASRGLQLANPKSATLRNASSRWAAALRASAPRPCASRGAIASKAPFMRFCPTASRREPSLMPWAPPEVTSPSKIRA